MERHSRLDHIGCVWLEAQVPSVRPPYTVLVSDSMQKSIRSARVRKDPSGGGVHIPHLSARSDRADGGRERLFSNLVQLLGFDVPSEHRGST